MNRKKLSLALAGATGLCVATGASAGVGWKAGDWDVDISGNVNGFFVNSDCDSPGLVAGGLACAGGDTVSVRSGLLPSALVLGAKSRQGNFDVGFTFGMYPSINSESTRTGVNGTPGNLALGSGSLDFRQNFFTFGDSSWGTIKIGRDIGIFGSDAILSDMTLLGVGGNASGALPGNTSLGRIGLGYIYADFMSQITYTSPDWSGVQLAAGVFQPLDSSLGAATAPNAKDSPMFQGKITYGWSGDLSGKVWAGFVQQDVDNQPIAAGGTTQLDASAFDVGAKVGIAGLELVGYYYDGDGAGTTGILLAGADANGNERDSDGGYVQATYKIGKAKLGVSWGESNLDLSGNEPVSNLVKSNEAFVAGIYYALTKSVNLVIEYIDVEAEGHDGSKDDEETLAIGGIMFF